LNDAYSANDIYLKRMNELSQEKNHIINYELNKNDLDEPNFLEKANFSEQSIQSNKKFNQKNKQKSKNYQNDKNIKSKKNYNKNAEINKLIKSAIKKVPSGPRKLQIKYIPNNTLNKKIKNIESYSKCNVKTGILNLVKFQDQLPFTLNLLPVYIHLGLSTFNIYKNENSSTLMSTVKLIEILRINQRGFLKDNFCFDLMIADSVKMKLDDNELITLCAENKEAMDKWVHALLEFKECQVDVKKLAKNNEVVVDYKKVDELLKEKTTIQTPKQKLKNLYYDVSNTAIIKSPVTISKQTRIDTIVRNIMNSMKIGNIRTNQVRRQLSNKLKEARGFSEDISRKEEIIREMVEKRIEKERQKEVANISNKQRKKEVDLLRAVQQRIVQLKKQEVTEYSQKIVKEIRGEKEKASKQAKNMMRMLIDAKKLTPYYDCTDNRLLNFENPVYTNATCKRYYGEMVNYFKFFLILCIIYLFL